MWFFFCFSIYGRYHGSPNMRSKISTAPWWLAASILVSTLRSNFSQQWFMDCWLCLVLTYSSFLTCFFFLVLIILCQQPLQARLWYQDGLFLTSQVPVRYFGLAFVQWNHVVKLLYTHQMSHVILSCDFFSWKSCYEKKTGTCFCLLSSNDTEPGTMKCHFYSSTPIKKPQKISRRPAVTGLKCCFKTLHRHHFFLHCTRWQLSRLQSTLRLFKTLASCPNIC